MAGDNPHTTNHANNLITFQIVESGNDYSITIEARHIAAVLRGDKRARTIIRPKIPTVSATSNQSFAVRGTHEQITAIWSYALALNAKGEQVAPLDATFPPTDTHT